MDFHDEIQDEMRWGDLLDPDEFREIISELDDEAYADVEAAYITALWRIDEVMRANDNLLEGIEKAVWHLPEVSDG